MFTAGNGCPLCAESAKVFVTEEMRQRKYKKLKGYAWLLVGALLPFLIEAISGLYFPPLWWGIWLPSLLLLLIGWVIAINRLRRWGRMYSVETGYLLTECETETPHIHLGLPSERGNGNPRLFSFSVYRAEVDVDPVWVELKLEDGGEGTIVDSRLEQRRLDSAWSIRLRPFGLSFDSKSGEERLRWYARRLEYISLQAMLQWIERWDSTRSYFEEILSYGNPIEEPWSTQRKLALWLYHILVYVKVQSPKPLNGAVMRNLLETALTDGGATVSGSPEHYAEVAQKMNAIIGTDAAAASPA